MRIIRCIVIDIYISWKCIESDFYSLDAISSLIYQKKKNSFQYNSREFHSQVDLYSRGNSIQFTIYKFRKNCKRCVTTRRNASETSNRTCHQLGESDRVVTHFHPPSTRAPPPSKTASRALLSTDTPPLFFFFQTVPFSFFSLSSLRGQVTRVLIDNTRP